MDDHVLFAKSLKIAFEDYVQINQFSIITDIGNVISVIENVKPDITLIDINLSNISNEDGLELAKNIMNRGCKTRIVMLTGYDLPVYRHEAKKIGVNGFINKNIMPDELLEILIDINNGIYYFPKTLEYIEELTDSEKQILQLLANGYKRKDIASIVFASERTVSNHIQHIFDKLDVSSSLEAVTKGLKLGYIQTDYAE
ncbi:LuxR family transcriptional regulator [Ureibacillus sinduriensis BLB-1 = JCM 15800]|uniref:LuxR family transcriptional regulator n=1 Tax=Ureibacillus sinduriensis BLB-1 = JCM 15800 TaxID=1384057 RepID=A0A0A3I863_9BACL|nr:LuxR family transcriptional regulator [Ureibacillus sinduriensis BLB-1 = JCM 15800]